MSRKHVLFDRVLIEKLSAVRLCPSEEEGQRSDRVHSPLAFANAGSAGRFLCMKTRSKNSCEDSEERLLGKRHLPDWQTQ
jgi:hypothetical protein